MRTRPGTTLVEAAVVLFLIGALCAATWPPLRRALDAFATRAAADAFVLSVAHTRALAIGRGGATLVLDPPAVRIETASGEPLALHTDIDPRVEIAADGTPPIRIPFDAMGLGRLASRTIRFRRGDVERVVTISAYGRVRQW